MVVVEAVPFYNVLDVRNAVPSFNVSNYANKSVLFYKTGNLPYMNRRKKLSEKFS